MMTEALSPDAAACDLAEARFRRDLYVLVAAVLAAPPSAAIAAALTSSDMVEAVRALGLSAAADRLAICLSRDPVVSADTDRQEYFALLAVPTGRYLTPFEAVHCDERVVDDQVVRGLLMGPSTRAVEADYERAGFKLAVAELPDHVACEVGFVAELWRREVAAVESGDQQAARAWREFRVAFVRKHPSRWIPALCERLERDTSSALYAAVAVLLRGLLSQELPSPGS
jgi:TorA maturation chaperone TorD